MFHLGVFVAMNEHFKDGRIIPVRAYRKGKERNNPEIYIEKRYIFDDEKIDNDINK